MDVTIIIALDPPAGAKEMDVQLSPSHLKVRRRASPPGEYIIDAAFTKAHRLDDSNWWIDDKKTLTVLLQKIKRSEWWMSVFQGHKEISWDQLQPEHPTYAEDLDGESQALVKKMMFDNQQRQRGLPTTDDLEKQALFKQFKEANPDFDMNSLMQPKTQDSSIPPQ